MLATVAIAASSTTLTASEAKDHIGSHATVCGTVASAKYAATTRGQPTFLDLDAAYPNTIFTVVIWGAERIRFSPAPETLNGQKVCATGTIETYRGKPEIVLTQPSQLNAEKPW